MSETPHRNLGISPGCCCSSIHHLGNQLHEDTTRFVTFPLGEQRYALDSSQVKELLMPSRVYSFPHTMHALEGVLVRRGSAIPGLRSRQSL